MNEKVPGSLEEIFTGEIYACDSQAMVPGPCRASNLGSLPVPVPSQMDDLIVSFNDDAGRVVSHIWSASILKTGHLPAGGQDHRFPAMGFWCSYGRRVRAWSAFLAPWLQLQQKPDLVHCCIPCLRHILCNGYHGTRTWSADAPLNLRSRNFGWQAQAKSFKKFVVVRRSSSCVYQRAS